MSAGPGPIFIVHAARKASAITTALIELLRSDGTEVSMLSSDTHLRELGGAIDPEALYVLKHSDDPSLTIAKLLHDAGARTFNDYRVVAECRDKAVVTQRLIDAGLPVPPSWFVADPMAASELLSQGPVIVKPNRGSKGFGVTVARSTVDLGAIDPSSGPFVVQRYHRPDGLDRKLYRIGADVFCVARPWPATTPADKLGSLLPVDAPLADIALRVGDALGIDLFGADVIVSEGQHLLIDVSSFPGFKGVPEAAERLAQRIRKAADSSPSAASDRQAPGA